MKMLFAMAALAALMVTGPAAAATATPAAVGTTTVWRCGPEGRVYSDTACADGRAVDVSDPRTAEQVAAAREVLSADLRRAEALRRERALGEHSGQAARATPHKADAPLKKMALREPAPKPPRGAKKKPADDGTWRAVAPASPRAPG
jgi:hypothetical protein